MAAERRNTQIRGEVFKRVLEHVVKNSAARFDLPSFQALLAVPESAARRILETLVGAGVVVEVQQGVWARAWANVLPATPVSDAC